MSITAESLWGLLIGFLLVTGLSLIVTLIWEGGLGKLYNGVLGTVEDEELQDDKLPSSLYFYLHDFIMLVGIN